MGIEMTSSTGGHGATSAVVGLDAGNPLEALADTIGEALGLAPEPGSAFAPSPPSAPQWQIEAGF
jgi:hypothetical protein